jgi:diguanylate cyclase (GGDEF)-like protein
LERLGRESDRLARNGPAASLVTVDLDHFKQLNDACGHAAGDHALVQLAKLFEANVRRVDTAARTGGEEFVILLPQTALEQAIQLAEKLRVLIEAERFEGETNLTNGQLTASFGVTNLQAGEAIDTALDRADRALYRAKSAGRNRVESIPSSEDLAGRASDQTSGIVAKMPSAAPTPKSST